MRFFGRRHAFRRHRKRRRGSELSLCDIAVGEHACVCGYKACMPPERRAYLQAYGLMPGYCVRVLQQHPVTVVQIENMELAMEANLARQVQVKPLDE